MSAPEGRIAAFLRQSAGHSVDIRELAERWRMACISVRCADGADLVAHPNTPAKVRGAWGRALAEGASPGALSGGPCMWDAPCAYDLFFNVQGRLTSRLEIPKPFVIAVDREGDDLLVSLTLFGAAADWAGEAADGLVRGLRRGLDQGRRRFVPEGVERRIGLAESLPIADLSRGAVLSFLSPVALRSGAVEHAAPGAMLTSLANRIGGLARWHGARLEIDPEALKSEAGRAARSAQWVDDRTVPWRQRSHAQGRDRAVTGLAGTLLLPAVSPMLAALLTLGAEAHLGGSPASGGHARPSRPPSGAGRAASSPE